MRVLEKTLRDEIAIAALQGVLASCAHPQSHGPTYEKLQENVKFAYAAADAMLKERGQGDDRL